MCYFISGKVCYVSYYLGNTFCASALVSAEWLYSEKFIFRTRVEESILVKMEECNYEIDLYLKNWK